MLKQILEYTFVKFHINPSSITQQFSPHLYVYASVNFTYAQHPLSPHPGYCGAFARLGSPGGGAFANFALPGGRAFANPRAIPELLTRTRFPIRI